MKLSEHFTLDEMTFSDTAVRLMLDNTPTPEVIEHLRYTAEQLEIVRAQLNHPIIISSGYRSWELNSAIGGSRVSFHPLGLAVDFRCPGFGPPLDVCNAIAAMDIPFDQLIHEFGRWTHLGFQLPNMIPRHQLLTARKEGGRTVYVPGLLPLAA